jgi:hypothetical protein
LSSGSKEDGRNELGRQEDPSLQRHDGPLHARLVGALPIQYPSICSWSICSWSNSTSFAIRHKVSWMARGSLFCAVYRHLRFFFSDSRLGLGWVLIQFVRGGKKYINFSFSQTFLILSRLEAFSPVMSSVIIYLVNHIKFPLKEAELVCWKLWCHLFG